MTRLELFRKSLKDLDMDSAVILDQLNQHYLSGFSFTDGLLLITPKRAFLITDFRYYEMAQKNAFPYFEVVTPKDRRQFITDVMKQDNSSVVGFEGSFMSFDTYKNYCSAYDFVKFEDMGKIIESLRMVKDSDEIEKMQKAQDITDKAFSHILNMINTNMTEIDVAAELEYVMRKNGASGLAFDTIAVSGDASALPHGTPRNVKLKSGFLTMDFGAKFDGYCSDMTRTIVIGKADAEIKELYNTVLKAQLSAIDFLRAGVDCKEADAVARNIIDSNVKYKGAFGHSLGHSVGLFIHEMPSLSVRGKGRALRCGEVVTVEPGIYLYGKYGCRIEDMVKITEKGVYNFTHSTKDLIEIL